MLIFPKTLIGQHLAEKWLLSCVTTQITRKYHNEVISTIQTKNCEISETKTKENKMKEEKKTQCFCDIFLQWIKTAIVTRGL